MDEPRQSQLRDGAVFGGRYRVVRAIKSGGMGAVYEVVDERTRGPRALKVMLPSTVSSADQRARFEQEAQVTGAVDSEHVVRVYDAGVDAVGPFLVMELLRGEELQDLLDRRGKLDPEEVCRYLMQASRALDKTFAAGIVHRDIKPANLFVAHRDDGTPCLKILDFGLAKLILPDSAKKTRALGTPLYMSPEQVKGEGGIGPRADLYALAHVAYSLITGEPYWTEEGKASASSMLFLIKVVAGAQEAASMRALRRTDTKLPPGFDAWFWEATAPDPAQRFDGALAQMRALAALWMLSPTPSTQGPAGLDAKPPTVAPVTLPSRAPAQPPSEVAAAPTQWALTAHGQQTAPMGQRAPPTLAAHAPAPPFTATATRRARTGGRALAIGIGLFLAFVGVGGALLTLWPRDEERPRRRGAGTAGKTAASSASSAPAEPELPCFFERCTAFAPPVPSNVEISVVLKATDGFAKEYDPKARWAGLSVQRVVGDSAVDLDAGMSVHYAASKGGLYVTVRPPQLLLAVVLVATKPLPDQVDCTVHDAVKRARSQGFGPQESFSMHYLASYYSAEAEWFFSSPRRTVHLDARCAVKNNTTY